MVRRQVLGQTSGCLLWVVIMLPHSVFAEIWMTAPQLCAGRPYSASAKAANWEFDAQQFVSFASEESPVMLSSVYPGEGSDFVLQLRVRLAPATTCRLTLYEMQFDLSRSADKTHLIIGSENLAFENPQEEVDAWTRLTIRRRANAMTAMVNGEPAVDLGDSTKTIKTISLQAIRGTMATSHFTLTGQLQRHTR